MADVMLSVSRSGGNWMVVTLEVEGVVSKDTTSLADWRRTIPAHEFDFVNLRAEAKGATPGRVQVSVASSKSGLKTVSGLHGSVFGTWGIGFEGWANDVAVGTGSSCCRMCSVGKPCGDTCISRDLSCNVAPGCAC